MNIKDKASSSSSLSLSGRRKNNSSIDTPDLIGLNTRLEQRDVLKDLLNTLYSRLEAIIQGQHYVLFIVQNLAKVREMKVTVLSNI